MAKKSKKIEITDDDLKEYSFGEILGESYGKKGTPKRIAAEKRINKKAKNLVSDNKKKEVKESNEVLFLKFAKEFSKKASRVSAGDKIPSIYISDEGGFRIDYYSKFIPTPTRIDENTGRIVPIPARINIKTGIIEVSKISFMRYTVPKRIKLLLSLYAKWVNKNELNKENGKTGYRFKTDKSVGKTKKGLGNKTRAGKKNTVRKRNSKKSGSTK